VGVAVKAQPGSGAGTVATQRFGDSTLDDAEQRRCVGAPSGAATLRPAQGALHRRPHAQTRAVALFPRGAGGTALVESHRDVCPEGLLHRDGTLGGQLAAPPVEGRGEGHPVLVDDEAVGHRRHLEATAVGEPGSPPAREPVQTALGLDQGLARSLVQVVGVGEQNLRPRGAELLGGNAAHRAEGRYRREGRRLDDTIAGVDAAGACRRVAGRDLEKGRCRHVSAGASRRRRSRSGSRPGSLRRTRRECARGRQRPRPAAAATSGADGSS
jgi:hypothetical protein